MFSTEGGGQGGSLNELRLSNELWGHAVDTENAGNVSYFVILTADGAHPLVREKFPHIGIGGAVPTPMARATIGHC